MSEQGHKRSPGRDEEDKVAEKKQKVDLKAELRHYFSRDEIKEIHKGIKYDGHRYGELADDERAIASALEDRKANHWQVGFKFLILKGTKIWRRCERVIGFPEASLQTRDAWLQANGFNLPAILSRSSAFNIYKEDDPQGPFVHWVNPETKVVITGQLKSFGFSRYCGISGPHQAARATYEALVKECSCIEDISPYEDGLCENLNPAQHAKLMQSIEDKTAESISTPDNVFDPACCRDEGEQHD